MFRLIFLLVSLVGMSEEYSMGAPDAACQDMIPNHRLNSPQVSLPPANLTVSSAWITPGEIITLELTALGDIKLMGFMLQARDQTDKSRQVGSFIGGEEISYLTCGRGIHNAVTHRNPKPKSNITVQWRAPSDFEGNVIFRFTCLHNYSTYWVGLETSSVRVTRDVSPPVVVEQPNNKTQDTSVKTTDDTSAAEEETTTQNFVENIDEVEDLPQPSQKLEETVFAAETDDQAVPVEENFTPLYISSTTTISTSTTTESTTPEVVVEDGIQQFTRTDDDIYSGCNTSKACFGIPMGCVSSGKCQVIAAYWPHRLKYHFEMKGLSQGYLAFGLSSDNKMGEDLTTNCILQENGNVDIATGYNYGYSGNRPPPVEKKADGISERIASGRKDGWIYCSWTRERMTVIEREVWDMESKVYHVMLAVGRTREGQVEIHSQKLISEFPAGLGEVGIIRGRSRLYILLHGAFMIGAWICSASLGIIIARYYKSTWINKKMWGLAQWFIWHRMFMMLAWALTIVAFVLILVEVQDISKTIHTNPHTIIGFVTVALAFIQPFLALIRCNPMHRFRWVFNWLHWFIGNSAQILAIVCIFYAVDLEKAQLPRPETDWLLIGFVAFHFLTHLILSAINCVADYKHATTGSYPVPMRALGHHMSQHGYPDYEELKRDSPGSGLRLFTLIVYLIINVLVSAALILLVVLSPTRSVLEELNILPRQL